MKDLNLFVNDMALHDSSRDRVLLGSGRSDMVELRKSQEEVIKLNSYY